MLMVFTRKDRDFPWRFVSLPGGYTEHILNMIHAYSLDVMPDGLGQD